MKIYSRGNTAKQWMLEQISNSSNSGTFRVCDFGCGYGSVWPEFLKDHQNISYLGLDTDKKEIERARRAMINLPNAEVKVADGQAFGEGEGTFDAVTAFSALEHIVNLEAFMRTVFGLLKKDGRAYLNYDAGHFRSNNPKERIMVPVSQFLAKVGFQGPYMKEVKDRELQGIIERAGGKVVRFWKFNLAGMKNLVRANVTDDTVRAWYDFELRMNELNAPDALDRSFWSTVAIIEKI